MGATFEVLTPASQRGRTLDLGLSKLRNRTTAGRVFLVAERAGQGPPAVFKETPAPDDKTLDARVIAVAEAVHRVRDPAFVALYNVGRGASRTTLGLLTEYVEGRIGVAPPDPPLRIRSVQRAGVHLLSVLERLHREHGLVHGDVQPGNILVGALDPTGAIQPARLLDLGTGAIGSIIADVGGAAFRSVGRRLGESLVCTPTAWGTPGYTPPGRFAQGAVVTAAGDLFACVLSLWELLTDKALFAPPERVRSEEDELAHYEARMREAAHDASLGDALSKRLREALPGAPREAVGRWGAAFAQWVSAGITRTESLSAAALASELAALPDPYGVAGEAHVSSGHTWTGAAPVLERGGEYSALVVLDYFGGAMDGPAHDEAHRRISFRHVAMLGEGAMGSVHRVDVLRPGGDPMPAALKIAIDDNATNRDAIVREAHVLRAQRYDGIAQFLALVELPGGALALLMDYQPGVPLDVLLDTRRLTSREAMTLGRRILGTLASLHADPELTGEGGSPSAPQVVHGDIKPGNIIVPRDAKGRPDFGAAVLIDFGVARLRSRLAAAAPAEHHDEQVVGGTIGYMPRGQITLGATPASDVFAVAVVLQECLTLKRPYSLADAEKYSPMGLAFALEERMKTLDPEPIGLREVPPWRRNRGWRRFFSRVLARGDMDLIPAAHVALAALEDVSRDHTFALAVGAVAMALAAAVGVWFQRDYCPSGQSRCDRVCTDLMTNAHHCGGCDVQCASGEVCASGVCKLGCAEGQTLCDGRCTDLATDRAHCGACGHLCGAGTVCSAGECTLTCAPGLTQCEGSCRDLHADLSNCGACGHACNSGEVCTGARCETSCGRALTNCNGVCRDLATDRAHCGACTRVCAAGQVCSAGACTVSCGAGTTNCSGVCRELQTDRAHCGQCGRACAAGEGCQAGQCVRECGADLSLCGGRCRDTAVDPGHCGECGHACGAGERCANGRCALSCPSSLSECGGQCRDTAVDRANCGSCGRQCASGQVCASGRCQLVCPDGLSECGGQCVDAQTDEGHCGRCEIRCANGSFCVSGACARSCPDGLSDCGGRCRDTRTDEDHCGSCGRACGDAEACVSGHCRSLATAPVVPTPSPVLVAPTAPVVGHVVPKL